MSEQERRASLMVLLRVAIDHDRSSRLWLLVICVASRARYLVCVRPCAYLCTQARRPSSTNSSSVRASVQFRPWASTSRPLPTRRSSSTSGYVANQRTTAKEQRRERESANGRATVTCRYLLETTHHQRSLTRTRPAARQDVGGQDKIRPLWRHYFAGTQALIFVIDSEDRARIDEAQQELFHIINDPEMRNAVLLVFANKQDMPSAMSATELAEALGLAKLSVPWTVQGTCALTGDGLADGLTWLSEQVGGK